MLPTNLHEQATIHHTLAATFSALDSAEEARAALNIQAAMNTIRISHTEVTHEHEAHE